MNTDLPIKPRPLFPLLLVHLAAAGVCFAFFLFTPIGVGLIFMVIGNDSGGPMFFPLFVGGATLFALVVTMILGGAALVSDLLRRRYLVPIWIPPLAVFGLAAGSIWSLAGENHPVAPLAVGCLVAVAFMVHWAAISTAWFLARILFRLFSLSATL